MVLKGEAVAKATITAFVRTAGVRIGDSPGRRGPHQNAGESPAQGDPRKDGRWHLASHPAPDDVGRAELMEMEDLRCVRRAHLRGRA